MAELVKRLSELGLSVARVRYSDAIYAGTNDVEVHLNNDGTTAEIVATSSGGVLGFIEFGTGVHHPLGEYASQVGAPPHGTYGHKLGRLRSWYYRGDPGNGGEVVTNSKGEAVVHTTGNDPADAFPAAVKEMQKQLTEIAQEVFSA